MSEKVFTAFYPSTPIWVGDSPQPDLFATGVSIYEAYATEVFTKKTTRFCVKVCRDGQILLRIPDLEARRSLLFRAQSTQNEHQPPAENLFDKSAAIRGEYLALLNIFFLLLDSNRSGADPRPDLGYYEITPRDAFQVLFTPNEKPGAFSESASIHSAERTRLLYGGPSSFIKIPRAKLPISLFEQVTDKFRTVLETEGLVKTLALYAKAVSELKSGGYRTSVVLAWFVIEEVLIYLWQQHLESLDVEYASGRRRMNEKRRKILNDRQFTASVVSNTLEITGVITNELFNTIDRVRGYRNKIVHNDLEFGVDLKVATAALECAGQMIERRWAFKISPNLSVGVSTFHEPFNDTNNL
ncbi:hypothetical protein ABLT15_28040 [Paraburkholderia tropica]|uniref:hypothetical protein n=1 Tax=Paraburkholderia tropica TaxID=92647 RepID=UPI0032B53362